jgi:ArsR family transcriptional regulator, arsenate/arsenite/antimonite-responsive transcriptional repressor
MYDIIISMNNEMNRKAFKALGDPTRLHIVEFLSKMCCNRASINDEGGVEGPTAGEVCCHITGAEKITSTVSQHLHELEAVELIQIERRGKSMICSLKPQRLETLADYLRDLAQSKDGESCCESQAACCTSEVGCC